MGEVSEWVVGGLGTGESTHKIALGGFGKAPV